jgi:hypothetical protein
VLGAVPDEMELTFHPPPLRCHSPRRRGIQCSAAPGVTEPPAFAGDDTAVIQNGREPAIATQHMGLVVGVRNWHVASTTAGLWGPPPGQNSWIRSPSRVARGLANMLRWPAAPEPRCHSRLPASVVTKKRESVARVTWSEDVMRLVENQRVVQRIERQQLCERMCLVQ